MNYELFWSGPFSSWHLYDIKIRGWERLRDLIVKCGIQ